ATPPETYPPVPDGYRPAAPESASSAGVPPVDPQWPEQRLSSWKLHPGQGIGRKSGNGNRNHRRWNRNYQTIKKRLTHTLTRQNISIVAYVKLGQVKGMVQNSPPAVLEQSIAPPQGTNQQANGGQGPQQSDCHHRRM
ncbi:MAG: hypothetical protein F6K31_34155, partial [Symploca sp. SIO2G7]|nr:hypothetical protein [Symploca sp. SIO2G7]